MSHPSSVESRGPKENPFQGLHIADNSILNTVQSRYICGKCYKSRKYFCYSCFTPHPDLQDIIPRVKTRCEQPAGCKQHQCRLPFSMKITPLPQILINGTNMPPLRYVAHVLEGIMLPIKIDIIKHKREIDGKSTSAHAAILAPEDVKVYTYPDLPCYENERVVLIFPSHTALEIPQLFTDTDFREVKSEIKVDYPKGYNQTTLLKNLTGLERVEVDVKNCRELPITKAVFIDSTWNQSKGIYKDERIKSLPCVVLQNRISQFWRHQKGSPRWYLATVEAIHQFVLEVHLNAWGVSGDYNGITCCFSEKGLEKYQGFVGGERGYKGEYDNLLYFFEHMYKLIHSYYDHDNLYAYKRRML